MIRTSDKILIITTFVLFLVLISSFIHLPYYVTIGGGINKMDDSYIEVENETKSSGSYNIAFVKEGVASIPQYLLSFIIPGWETSKIENSKLNDFETAADIDKRDKMLLNNANAIAIKNAYTKAGKTYNLKNTYITIAGIVEKDSKFKIGDTIISIDNKKISTIEDIYKIVDAKKLDESISVEVKRNKKIINIQEKIKLDKTSNKNILGIYYTTTRDFTVDPKIDISFRKNQTGPSAGLIVAINIYDKLVKEDITKGLKIVGTGTIDYDGTVGPIGGVKFKLKGAVKGKADIFIVPDGDNYKECLKLKEKYNYKIKLINVKTFDEAIDKLKEI